MSLSDFWCKDSCFLLSPQRFFCIILCKRSRKRFQNLQSFANLPQISQMTQIWIFRFYGKCGAD